MNKKNIITHNPDILGGKAIIAGTRMSVESILESFSSGMEMKDLLKEYPFLNKEHIQAALEFAKKLVSREESYIFDKSHIVRS